jgi:hypothetical protein
VLVALVDKEDSAGYEVFVGNKHDSKTIETIVQQMEARWLTPIAFGLWIGA